MKAAIYNPYLDTLGGGERYSLAVAIALAGKGYRVDVQWESQSIKKALEKRFGIVLSDVNFVKDVGRGDGYDVCFWVSDGSIPILKARKNFLHFQVPFQKVKGKTLLNRMKLFRISKVICNSKFTKSFIDKEYGVEAVVIYPPVPVDKIRPRKKENLILFVGRFSQLEQVKKQDVLVSAFKRLYGSGLKHWRLVLAGGVEVGGREFVQKLKKSVGNYPIEILESPSFKEIASLYGRAKIFWSAVGFGINEQKEPEKVEHFGISVVEAMAGGAVPIVYSSGGYKEIIKEGTNGFLWTKTAELIKLTKRIIGTRELAKSVSTNAIGDSSSFGYERFSKEFLRLI